jgi:hypothetical protein
MLVCTASVESMMVPGNAEIDVECKDEKFAANVQACLQCGSYHDSNQVE